ncbi:MAG: tol-pal system protein YbgF [Nevskia sp.]|nr:tol-pal system protein YbgF [Nevskia sp.]
MTRTRLSMWVRKPAPLMAALVLSACATDYGAPINGQRALSPEEQRLQAVENKTVDLSRRLGSIESQQNGSQADDLRNLHGQIEQLQHDLSTLQQTVQQQNSDFDTRLKRLEGGAQPPAAGTDPNAAAGAAPPAAAAPAVAAPVVQAPPAAAPAAVPAQAAAPASNSASADEEAIYLKSFDQLRASKYDAAISGFRSMLSKYPQGNYADNAWYWMGESYHVKGDDTNALKSYQSLLQQFPASPKVPDALLKTGVIYQGQQKNAQARDAYQKVLKQYPNSSAAGQARNRLASLH